MDRAIRLFGILSALVLGLGVVIAPPASAPKREAWLGLPRVELSVPVAEAADIYLGTIVTAGTDITNATTAAPFAVPSPNKLSVQCDAIAYVLIDTTTAVTASNGAKVAADQLFQTSTSCITPQCTSSLTVGGQTSATVRAISASGTANCKVFRRYGNE
jgi:hypothetical protein